MPLRRIPELEGTTNAGVYVISTTPPSMKGDPEQIFKVGRSTSLKKRINSYALCYVHGFYLYYVILAKPTQTKEQMLQATRIMERMVHNELLDLQVRNPSRAFHEWFSNRKRVKQAVIAAAQELDEFGLAVIPPITKWSDPFIPGKQMKAVSNIPRV